MIFPNETGNCLTVCTNRNIIRAVLRYFSSIYTERQVEIMYLDHRITIKIARILDMIDLSALLLDANGNVILP